MLQHNDPPRATPMPLVAWNRATVRNDRRPRPYSRAQTPLASEIRELVGYVNPIIGGRVLGVDESDMCRILADDLRRFSLQRLIRMLARIDRRVRLTVDHGTQRRVRFWNNLRRPT